MQISFRFRYAARIWLTGVHVDGFAKNGVAKMASRVGVCWGIYFKFDNYKLLFKNYYLKFVV